MPDITPVVRPPNPIVEIIRRAVNAAHAAGLTVSTVPDLGVHCVSTAQPLWEVEQRVQVISPLGAVLLALQPQIVEADAALAHALGVNRIWICGFDEGQAGEKSDLLVDSGPAAQLYGQGFTAGVEFRAVMHRRAGVPVERPDAPTRPIPLETPRALVAGLLATLTVSQVLEAAADDLRERGPKLPADQADDLAQAEAMLREFAADFARVDGEEG
jgi:hypothetical protein